MPFVDKSSLCYFVKARHFSLRIPDDVHQRKPASLSSCVELRSQAWQRLDNKKRSQQTIQDSCSERHHNGPFHFHLASKWGCLGRSWGRQTFRYLRIWIVLVITEWQWLVEGRGLTVGSCLDYCGKCSYPRSTTWIFIRLWIEHAAFPMTGRHSLSEVGLLIHLHVLTLRTAHDVTKYLYFWPFPQWACQQTLHPADLFDNRNLPDWWDLQFNEMWNIV